MQKLVSKKVSNHLKMTDAVLLCLNQNAGLWGSWLAFGTRVTLLQTKRDALVAAINGKPNGTGGVTDQKKQVRAALEAAGMVIVQGLKSLALNTNDLRLYADVNYNAGPLSRMSDTAFMAAMNKVSALATAKQSELANYNVTAQQIADFAAAVPTYAGFAPEQRNAVAVIKQTNALLAALVRETASNLRVLDKMMGTFKGSQQDFYTTYFDNRKLVPFGQRHNTFEGVVMKDGVAVPGASVRIEGEDKMAIANWNGQFKIEHVRTGTFTAIVTNGTDEKTLHDLEMKSGEELKMDIELAA